MGREGHYIMGREGRQSMGLEARWLVDFIALYDEPPFPVRPFRVITLFVGPSFDGLLWPIGLWAIV
jgi:hypothetical protein